LTWTPHQAFRSSAQRCGTAVSTSSGNPSGEEAGGQLRVT
jgi:hypothetical protein